MCNIQVIGCILHVVNFICRRWTSCRYPAYMDLSSWSTWEIHSVTCTVTVIQIASYMHVISTMHAHTILQYSVHSLKHGMESPVTSAIAYIQDNGHRISRHKYVFWESTTEGFGKSCRWWRETIVNLQTVLGTAIAFWDIKVEYSQLYISHEIVGKPGTLVAYGIVCCYWLRECWWTKWYATSHIRVATTPEVAYVKNKIKQCQQYLIKRHANTPWSLITAR